MSRFSVKSLLIAAAALAATATAPAFALDPVNTNWRGIAAHGYDVVAYFTDGKAVEGSADIAYDWQGAHWRFATAEHRDAFKAAPEKYAPQYGGYCAYAVGNGKTADIDPDAWTVRDGKLYLNYDKDIQKKWLDKVVDYIRAGDENWPKLLKK